jgi:hypothetical protein
MPRVPESLTCGTRCFSRLDDDVRVTGDDYQRFGARTDELVQFDGHRAYMRMVDGNCGALVLDANSRQLLCCAYAVRPQGAVRLLGHRVH